MHPYFLPIREKRKIISPITTSTIRIPKPIPALNIPLITEQEFSDTITISAINNKKWLEDFMP
jgi:hypothetical protein